MCSLKAIQNRLPVYSLDAILLLSSAAQRYACGFSGSGFVLVSKQSAFCCVSEMEKLEAECCVKNMPVMAEKYSFAATLRRLCENGSFQIVGFEETKTSIAQLWAYQKEQPFNLVPAENLLEELRLVKADKEQQNLKAAQSLTEAVFLKLLPLIHPGIRESELRAAIASELFRAGADELAFPPVVAFGERSASPHGLPGDAELHSGELVLLDMGCVLDGYCSDLSRTVCCGRATAEQKRSYRTLIMAKAEAERELRGSVTGEMLQKAVAGVMEENGFSAEMSHKLLHGIGMEVHEAPDIDRFPIPAGSALALEPGIYIPGKYGIRIEDVYLVRENGCIPLSSAPDTIPEVCT